jgi:hypothetical protein
MKIRAKTSGMESLLGLGRESRGGRIKVLGVDRTRCIKVALRTSPFAKGIFNSAHKTRKSYSLDDTPSSGGDPAMIFGA